MTPRPNRTAYEESKSMRELQRQEEARERAVLREDREKEKSSWRDEADEQLARVGLS
jgi:hypothetical protein